MKKAIIITGRMSSVILLVSLLIFNWSCCEDELKEFDTISYAPCEDTNVVKDTNIISDFECQANVELTGVETVRNPAEIQINKSKFVGRYVDGAEAWDNLLIDYGTAINLATHGVFKIKVRTQISGTLLVKLEGGTSTPVEKSNIVEGNNGWAEHAFNFSDQGEENHTKLVIFFNAGVESGGADQYFIDDLFWDLSIDPCEGVTEDLSIISDFECQQNYFLGDPNDATSAPLIDNPYKVGINTSDNVGEYTDDGTNAWDNLIIDLGDPIDLSVKSQLSIKIYSTRTAPILAKLEGGTTPMEIWSNIETTDDWVEYIFDFRAAESNGNTKVVLFFNGGATDGSSDDIYYIDDIKFTEWIDPCLGVAVDSSIISDFECQQNQFLGNPNIGTSAPVVDNPNPDSVNDSDSVGEFTDDGLNAWDNLYIDYGTEIDLSVNNQLNIKVLSDRTAPLLAKLEGGTAIEIWGSIDVTGEWKNYTFDFSAADGLGNTKVILFFNGGASDGTNADVYYIDDIRFMPLDCGVITENCAGVTPDLNIINDFNCQQNFDTPDGIPVIENPNVSCANRSSHVGKFTDDGTNAWDNLIIDFGAPIDLSTNNQLKIKIQSSMAVPILAKIEGGAAHEIWGNITVLDEWVEYAFDFSGSAGDGNTKLVLFFNAGETNGTNQDIYYVDDIRFDTQ